MKKINVILAALLVCGVAWAAQDTTLTERELRNPKTLETWLEANASDAETRIAAVEAAGVGGALASGKIIVGNSGGTGEAQTVTGDISLSNAGVAAIASGAVVNADIATNAAIVATKISGTAVTYSTAAQSDTNATTVVTAYTPAFIGQVLIGLSGSTNYVWLSRGTTTNDWQQIAP